MCLMLQGGVDSPQLHDPLPMSGPAAATGARLQWRHGGCGQEAHTEGCERGGAARGTAGSHGPIR
jgi:hypothetical protein